MCDTCGCNVTPGNAHLIGFSAASEGEVGKTDPEALGFRHVQEPDAHIVLGLLSDAHQLTVCIAQFAAEAVQSW